MDEFIKSLIIISLPRDVIGVHISTYKGVHEIEVHMKHFEEVARMKGVDFSLFDGHVHAKAPHPVAPYVIFAACRKLSPAPKEGGAE